ncbi:MAG TPA: 16S rRNA (adenine(1518)-N(6)/adenine(1519)-N(6))-dimethyltransferase RsmA [Candidatus Paceibacterota bacterium]
MELWAKKSLGQHFLNSPAALAHIVEAGKLSASDLVLEIGPGTGILTEALLATGARVIAVEKDDRAYELLQTKCAAAISEGKLVLRHGDILESDRVALGLADGSYKLIANIPYYITGQILETFLEYSPRPSTIIVLVQKEVAERIVARDGKESILSISVKAFGTPRIVAKVPRGAFVPPPTVDSAILEISNISAAAFTQNSIDIRRFFEIVKAGFAHKRKILRKNLFGIASDDKIAVAWLNTGLNDKSRAEDLTPDQWMGISKNL